MKSPKELHDEQLVKLHTLFIAQLTKMVKEGEEIVLEDGTKTKVPIRPAALNVIAKYLKDQNVEWPNGQTQEQALATMLDRARRDIDEAAAQDE